MQKPVRFVAHVDDNRVLKSLSVSERIRHRKEELNRRREALSVAMSILSQGVAAEAIAEQELSRERCANSLCIDVTLFIRHCPQGVSYGS